MILMTCDSCGKKIAQDEAGGAIRIMLGSKEWRRIDLCAEHARSFDDLIAGLVKGERRMVREQAHG